MSKLLVTRNKTLVTLNKKKQTNKQTKKQVKKSNMLNISIEYLDEVWKEGEEIFRSIQVAL